MALLETVEADLATFGDEIVAGVKALEAKFDTDVWPYVKAFVVTLLQQEGQDALKAAVAALPIALADPEAAAAAVGAAVAGSLAANAAADAKVEVTAAEANLAQ